MPAVGKTEVPTKYFPVVLAAAAKHGVPPAFLAAQIDAESSFNPNAKSPAGAIGIAQFMPGTANSLDLDPTDANASIYAMAKLMAYYKKEYGSWEKALYAYHDGPGKINNPGPAGLAYAKKILGKVGDMGAGVGSVIEGVGDAVNPFKSTEKLFDALRSPERWQRVGYWFVGGSLLMLGVFVIIWTYGGKAMKEATK